MLPQLPPYLLILPTPLELAFYLVFGLWWPVLFLFKKTFIRQLKQLLKGCFINGGVGCNENRAEKCLTAAFRESH